MGRPVFHSKSNKFIDTYECGTRILTPPFGAKMSLLDDFIVQFTCVYVERTWTVACINGQVRGMSHTCANIGITCTKTSAS